MSVRSLPHVQIFQMVVAIPTHLTCDQSNSPLTITTPHLPYISVFLVEDLPLLGSSSKSSRLSLNLLRHSKTWECDIVSSPYTYCNSPSTSDGVFSSRTRNFSLVRCSVPMAWRPKIEELLIKGREKKRHTMAAESWNCSYILPGYYVTRWRTSIIPTQLIAHTAHEAL